MYAFEAITKSGAFAVFRFEDGEKAAKVLEELREGKIDA